MLKEIISRSEAKALGLKEYYTGKPCKHGHIAERYVSTRQCVECMRLRFDYNKSWYETNREDIIEKKKVCRKANPEYHKAYYEANKESISEKSKARYEANPEVVFLRRTLSRLESYMDGSKYEKILGYTQEEFVSHIESLWSEGMSWENRSEWHIDHIKPIKAFINEGITDVTIINSLSNLQPLWAKDNLAKGCNYES